MTRPEIPQAAIDAALTELGFDPTDHCDSWRADEIATILKAAAPHIGTAYLRWALKWAQIDPGDLKQDYNSDVEAGWLWAIDTLTALARIEAGDE